MRKPQGFGTRSIVGRALFAQMIALGMSACAGTLKQDAHNSVSLQASRYVAVRPAMMPEDHPHAVRAPMDLDRGLPSYLAYAMAHSPDLRASFERWQASVYRISRARRLPEPTISFGYFVRSVETRVGPQRARIGLKQWFPWPTTLIAGADASSAKARAQQSLFDAKALVVAERVADAYWWLWEIRTNRIIHGEHLDLLRSLSESVRGRVATGATNLADLQQLDLAAARLEDSLLGMNEAEQSAQARLRAAIGSPAGVKTPTLGGPPGIQLPLESLSQLEDSARRHPLIVVHGHLSEAQEQLARAESGRRLPSFSAGIDWIMTGAAAMPDVRDGGKDALVVGAGLRVPLWQRSYSDAVSAARSMAKAQRADQRAATDRAIADLESSLSAVRNGVRRVSLHRNTLVPQADAAYASVLGAYATGRGTVAQVLLAQRDLLELRVELETARATYARSWARLERVVGRTIKREKGLRDESQ